jgi:hypothetical protein
MIKMSVSASAENLSSDNQVTIIFMVDFHFHFVECKYGYVAVLLSMYCHNFRVLETGATCA